MKLKKLQNSKCNAVWTQHSAIALTERTPDAYAEQEVPLD